MEYEIIFGKTPVETMTGGFARVVATDALEAAKIAIRSNVWRGRTYEILAEDGGNVHHLGDTSHFLVRISDECGILCVMPITVKAKATVSFPA